MTFLPIHSQISLQKREPKKQRRSLIVSDSNPNTDSGPTGAGLLNHKCTHIHNVMESEPLSLQNMQKHLRYSEWKTPLRNSTDLPLTEKASERTT